MHLLKTIFSETKVAVIKKIHPYILIDTESVEK